MDCPYYEQLQYGGDARIQMMISLYMTGDARLMKNGIALLNSSRTAEGATYSRAPSALQQYIPPFSLWWIGMVHDYWMYVDDVTFARQMLPGVHAILSFYAGYQKANSSLQHMPWWNFVDWVKQWPAGEPLAEHDGSSAAHLGSPGQRHAVMQKVMSDSSLAQSSIYFRAYTNAALREAGSGDQYLASLAPWREMLAQGLTTWAEWSGPDSRSDCHAWGASPNFELLRTVAGIESIAPGFARVLVAPNMGTLEMVNAEMPHPKGTIRVQLNRTKEHGGKKAIADIALPFGITGDFLSNGRTQPLQGGKNHLNF